MLVCLTPLLQAWEVKAGQLFRIVCVDGPQVADVNFWQLQNPKERFYASKTRQLHASHLKAHDRCAHTQRRCLTGHSWAMACRRAAVGSTCSVAQYCAVGMPSTWSHIVVRGAAARQLC